MGGRPPKIPTFSGFDPERLERGPQYSARRRNFQKSLRTVAVLRWGYNPPEKLQLIPIPAVSQPKNQKQRRFRPFWHRFQPNDWGTAVFKMSCSFVSLSSSPIAELKTYVVGIFEFFAYGPRYRGVFAGVLGQI